MILSTNESGPDWDVETREEHQAIGEEEANSQFTVLLKKPMQREHFYKQNIQQILSTLHLQAACCL